MNCTARRTCALSSNDHRLNQTFINANKIKYYYHFINIGQFYTTINFINLANILRRIFEFKNILFFLMNHFCELLRLIFQVPQSKLEKKSAFLSMPWEFFYDSQQPEFYLILSHFRTFSPLCLKEENNIIKLFEKRNYIVVSVQK